MSDIFKASLQLSRITRLFFDTLYCLRCFLILAALLTVFVSRAAEPAKEDPQAMRKELVRELEHATLDSVRCRICLQLGNQWLQESPDSAIRYFLAAARLAQQHEIREQTSDSFCRFDGEALRGLGNANYLLGNYEVAAECYTRALRCMDILHDRTGLLKCHNNLGLVLWKEGDYDRALDHYLKALDLAEQTSNAAFIGSILNNIGLLHWNHGNFDQAIEYYRRSLAFNRKLNNHAGISDAYNNIGLVNWKKGNLDSAILYYQKALEVKQELQDKQGISTCYTNMGLVFNDEGKHNLAIDYYLKALVGLEDRNEVALILGNISSAHLSIAEAAKDPAQRTLHLRQSVQFGQRSYDEADRIGAIPLVNAASGTLEKAWKELGNFREATRYAEIYIQTRDSMFTAEKSNVLAEMESRYAAEKKQLEIDRLLKERSYQAEILARTRTHNRIQGILLIITLLGIIIITVYTIWIARLNSRIRRNNAVLEIHRAEIEEKNLTKDKLFSVISHDLRNPFNVILGYSEFLVSETERLKDRTELHELAINLEHATKQVNNLLTNLLEWSLLQTDRLTPKTGTVSIRSLAEEIRALFSSQAGVKGIVIRNEIPASLLCTCDGEMIRSVLRNLVSNAIKFTSEGGTITLKAEERFPEAVISVADTGIGLSPEETEGLFTLRCRIPKGPGATSGTGLGLVICREFVQINRGELTVTGEPGKGTVFSFTLPLAPVDAAPGPKEPASATHDSSTKILVAEDNESNMFLLDRILSRNNYHVISARNGREALERLKDHADIRLVLLDLRMPVMDGLEACREIRKVLPSIPVVAQTGNNHADDIRELRDAGFTDWLFKPIEREVLLKMIGKYILTDQS